MDKFILLRGENIADALALATVIQDLKDYHVIRRSVFAPVFYKFRNVDEVKYTFSKKDALIVINPIETDKWEEKCDYIASLLGVKNYSYIPYVDFIEDAFSMSKYLYDRFCLLYFCPNKQQNIDLVLVDSLVRQMKKNGINSVSGGDKFLPCIKDTMDFRGLFNLPAIIKYKSQISLIITSEIPLYTLGQALGIKTFLISTTDKMMINNCVINDVSEMLNFISVNL